MIRKYAVTMSLDVMQFLLSNPIERIGQDNGAIVVYGVERLPNGQIFASTIKEWPVDPAARRIA